MRKLLLTFLCLFGFIAVWAQDGSFSATFKRGSDNNRPAYTTSTTLSDVFSEGANYFSAIKATSNCSPGTGGIKIGPNKSAGNITFTLSAAGQKKITSIVVNGCGAKNASQKPDVTINDVTVRFDKSANANPKDADFKDYTFVINANAPVQELVITTTYCAFFNKITVNYADGGSSVEYTEAPSFVDYVGGTGEYWDALNVKMNVPEGATVYYTTDDTTPTTSSTVYTAAGIDVPAATAAGQTFVIKAIAVADGKEPSAVVTLTLTAVKTITAELLSAIEAGGSYFLLADNTRLAGPIATGYYMPATEVALADGKLVASDANLFTFEAGDEAGQFYIKDANGKYYGMDATHNSFNTFADKASATNALWTVTFADGLATITNVGRGNVIAYQSKYNTFSSLTATDAASASLPAIYGEKINVPVVKQPAGLEFSAATAEATIGEAFTAPTLTFATTAAISYTSSTPAVATVDAATGVVTPLTEGTTTIMATSAANDDFEAGSAQYVLTVKAASTPVDPDQPTNVTIVYANHSADALDVTVDGINAKAVNNGGSTNPQYHAATAALRLYAKNDLTISGKEIEKIVFTLAKDAKYRYTTFTPSVGTMATQAKGDTQMTWTGDASSITFTVGEKATLGEDGDTKAGQIRISKIEIFVKGGGDTPTPPQPGEGYSSLAEWMQAKPAADEAINAALTVLYQNGKDLFVKQADTYGFVYGDVAQEYTNGQVIAAGATGHYEEYNGMPEIIPVASTFAKGYDGAPEAPQLITGDKVTEANLLHYVRLESAKVEATETDRQFTVTADGATFTLWNRWSKTVTNVAAADDADIYGFIGKTKIGDNIEVVLFPTRFEDNGGTPVNPGDNTATFDFTQPGSLSPAQNMPGAGADNAVDVSGVTFTSGVITLVNDKGTNNTSPRLYKSNEESEVELRVYNGGSTTISSTNGASITRIEFVTAYPANYDNSKADSGSLADAVWTGDATSVTFSWAKDSQGKYSPSMQKVIVTYGEGGEPGPVQPTEETATYNFQDPTTLSDPFEAPASGEGVELDGRTFTAGKTSITLSRGTNDKNAPRVFTSAKNVTDLRFYGDNTATIAGTGVTLKRIEFVCQYTSNFENSTASTGTLTDNIWTGEAASVDFHFLKSNPNSSGSTFNPSCTAIKVTYVTSDGIEEVVTIDTTPVEYYNLQGVRLEEPAPGQIVIRRQGNKVEKILVK
ncbi:MAG: FN3 associated domain-containing protein [Muribaculaceae bacterium]